MSIGLTKQFLGELHQVLTDEFHIEQIFEQLRFKLSLALVFDEMRGAVKLVASSFETNDIGIQIITEEELFKNPYLANIIIPSEQRKNGFIIGRKNPIITGMPIPYNISERDPVTLKMKRTCFILQSTRKIIFMPSLAEEDSSVCWMSIIPEEIKSFQKIIDDAHGHVLLFGCGLAYVAYMIARKPDVKSVTVVDWNEKVINLCQEVVIPQIPQEFRKKINFEISEAISYLKTCDLSLYDYINVDVWYDTPDMIFTYLRCLEIESSYPNQIFSYWLEEKLRTEFQRVLMMLASNYPNRSLNMPAGTKLIYKICQDLFDEIETNLTDELFKNFLNQDIKKLRMLLARWYVNNTSVYDAFYKKWEDEEKRFKEKNRARKPSKEALKRLAVI